jgi:hypothetical protein
MRLTRPRYNVHDLRLAAVHPVTHRRRGRHDYSNGRPPGRSLQSDWRHFLNAGCVLSLATWRGGIIKVSDLLS